MSVYYKMIVPLLDNTITKEDLSKDAHFVEAYDYDINRPQLTNHIFLLYEYVADKESNIRDAKFRSSPYLYDSDIIAIKKKLYFLYTFSVINDSIKRLRGSKMPINKKDLFRIYKFWDFTDEDVNDYIITKKVDSLFEDIHLPEIDWVPDEEDIFKTKRTGISI